jgi:UPF0755 protein
MLDELDLAYEEGESEMRPGRHRRRSRGGRSILAMILVLALLGALGGAGYWGFGKVRDFFTPADYTGPGHGAVQIQVETGQGLGEIANTLYNKGVIKSAKAFTNAAEDNSNATSIQPGWYRLRAHMKASVALAALLDLKNRISTKVTIPEGKTAKQIFAILAEKLHLPVSDFEKAAKNPSALGLDSGWFTRNDNKQVTKTVEGFLFPDTYLFDPGTTATDALTEMVQHFKQAASDAGLDKPANGLSPYQLLIVAYMTQAEAGVPGDLGKVARVAYNRLNSTEPWMQYLQFDSTTNYWLSIRGQGRKNSYDLGTDQLNDPSDPYSTTAHRGLPPGPIGCPGEAAMKAAVHPTAGPWLYFVKAYKDGRSKFETTNDQHQADVDAAVQAGIK